MALPLTAKKSLGQHFLTSDIVPVWMCDAGEVTAGEVVIEIGPGTGVLTRELLKRGAMVIGLETDKRALAVLEETFKAERAFGALSLKHADVRQVNFTDFLPTPTTPYKIIANIPYYLSGQLFRSTLSSAHQPATIVFLVQKEVAKRVIAGTNTNSDTPSLLSLSVQVYAKARYIKTVSRGHFNPPPRVDSAIIALNNISRAYFDTISETLFFKIIHLGFAQKRKQLLGNLSSVYSRADLQQIFTQIGLPLAIRAEALTLPQWKELIHSLSTLNTKIMPDL